MRVVGAIIRNGRGEFLLQLRDDRAPSYKNCWTLFGGIVNPDETPEDSIRRELFEEIRITADMIGAVTVTAKYRQSNGTRQVIFEVQTSATLDDLRLTEGTAMAFVSMTELFDRNYAFNIERVLEEYVSRAASWTLAA